MSRKTNKPKQRLPGSSSGPVSAEDALTIGWMLTVTTTLLCELGALAAHWYAARHAPEVHVAAMTTLVTLAAVVIGLLSLALLPVVLKVRKVRPPLGVTLFAVLVGLAPLATLLLW